MRLDLFEVLWGSAAQTPHLVFGATSSFPLLYKKTEITLSSKKTGFKLGDKVMFYITENGELELYFLFIEKKVDNLLIRLKNHYASEGYSLRNAPNEHVENYE